MEIFMGHNTLDPQKRGVGGGFWIGQYRRGIKDIQTFVFHGSHIEIIHRHNHKNIQIVLTAIDFLIPAHRVF